MALAQRLSPYPEPRSRVVVVSRPQARPFAVARPLLVLVSCWAVAVAVGLLLVHQHAQIAATQRQITDLSRATAGLEEENRSLRAEVVRLSSLDRIRDIAVNQLGMVPPADIRVAQVRQPLAQPSGSDQNLAALPPSRSTWQVARRLLAAVRGAVAQVRLAPARAEAGAD